jgi:hypothetical protein
LALPEQPGHDPRDGQPATADRADDLGEERPEGDDGREDLFAPSSTVFFEGLLDSSGGNHLGEGESVALRESVAQRLDLASGA